MIKTIISWTIRLVAAIILLQTLFFKFSGAAESVEIFTLLGMEPHGRFLIGILELVAAILILVPKTVAYGALLGIGLMSGAIIGHITKLGWAGEMFGLGMLAILVLVLCLCALAMHKDQLPFIKQMTDNG